METWKTDVLNQSYSNYPDTTGGIQYWQPIVETYYPMAYYTYWVEQPNKIEQSFKIVGKLIELKLIKINTVKQFIETVNEIAVII